MEFKQWLSEMPIKKFGHFGDWKPEQKPSNAYLNNRAPKKGYYKDDFGILTNKNAIEKIKTKWSKCPEDFNLFFVRSGVASTKRIVGQVDLDYLSNTLKLTPENVQEINDEDAINVVYTNNISGERMPMNWWTIAHRVGHAIMAGPGQNSGSYFDYFTRELRSSFYQILDQVFNYRKNYGLYDATNEKMLVSLANELGTMRSARERKIINFTEFGHELIAQYIIEGKVRFNPLPKRIITNNRQAWGRPNPTGKWHHLDADQIEMWSDDYIKDHMTPMTDNNISAILGTSIGKIFVM